MTYHILYNPLSGSGQGINRVNQLKTVLTDGELQFQDVREIGEVRDYLKSLSSEDALILAGGDGTINRFVNDTYGMSYPQKLYYYPTGTGNDFLNDVSADCRGLIDLHPYICNLPIVTVQNRTYRFVNGIGYGLDGYCCEVGEHLRKAGNKAINYSAIAIKGVLFNYKPTNATITVDGKSYQFKKVWIAPTMNGRFYGGGMMVAPEQDRLNSTNEQTLVVFHGTSRLKTLMIFPSVFKGRHLNYKKAFAVLKGHEFTVRFDRPVALQIDGETISDVTEYSVSANVSATTEIHA